MRCPQCGSTDIDNDSSRGDSACMQCGFIMTQNAIVSEIGFVEGANGASSVLGQFVPSTGAGRLSASAKTRGPGGRGPSVGYQKDSREHTIQNGRKHIQQVADHLRLRVHHVDSAVRLFMLAVQHNFIQGRRTAHVVAACLYIVCRREKTPHLLIDFSDVLQINLYVLGATFLKFIRLLNLSLPIIDPSLYIHRFAAQLELKDEQNQDKTHIVAMTALRLVARMKRDWMLVGRRPSGICGASLLIASRIHGFKRTQKEIIYIVKICDMTLRKRLTEFSNTQSSQLTLEEFEKFDVDLITNSKQLIASENEAILAREGPNAQLKADPFGIEQDPPAFTRNRVAEQETDQMLQQKMKLAKGKELLLSDLEFDTPGKPALLMAGAAGGASSSSPPAVSAAAAEAAAEARDREIQAIQVESRQLLESNSSVSDSIVAQIQEMIDGKQSDFAQLDEGPQRVVTSDLQETHVHVTPMTGVDLDATAAAASSAANTEAASSSSATAVPPPPLKERLKSAHKGPNLSHSRSRVSKAPNTPAGPSLLQPKDAPPNDINNLFTTPAAAGGTDTIPHFLHAGKPFADALAVVSDPSLMLSDASAPSTALVTSEADLSTWTDLAEFDQEIADSIILTEEESAFKTRAWESLNKDYLKEQEEKKALALAGGANGAIGPDGQPIARRQYKKKAKSGPAATPAEAAMRHLAEKKVSDKINYNALQGLLSNHFDDDKKKVAPTKVKQQLPTVGEDNDDDDDDDDDDIDLDDEDEDGIGGGIAGRKRGAPAFDDELPSAKQQRRTNSTAARESDEEDDADGGDDDDGYDD